MRTACWWRRASAARLGARGRERICERFLAAACFARHAELVERLARDI